jgi:hypothetical protein
MALKIGSLRRTTRIACRDDSPSGSWSACNAALHEAANGEVQHHQAEEFLPNQLRPLAAQDDLGAADWVFSSSRAVSISQRS